MSPEQRIGIICIALRDGVRPDRADDTHDTKAHSRDTSTIQGLLTMTQAGALNADFHAKIVPFPQIRQA
jgi:hypothetical protein